MNRSRPENPWQWAETGTHGATMMVNMRRAASRLGALQCDQSWNCSGSGQCVKTVGLRAAILLSRQIRMQSNDQTGSQFSENA